MDTGEITKINKTISVFFLSSCIDSYKKFDEWRTLMSKLWDETVFQAFSDCGYTKDRVLSPEGYHSIGVVSYNYVGVNIDCFRVNRDPLFAFITDCYGNTNLVYFKRKDGEVPYDCMKIK